MADEAQSSAEVENSNSSYKLESSNSDESNSSGTNNDKTTDEDGSDSGESTRTEYLTFQSQFSMPKLMKLICALTKPQIQLIDQCGFGSILKLKCSNMPYRQLIVWLARCYDAKTQCIKIPGTRPFKIDARTVRSILGIPCGGAKIKAKASLELKSFIANDTTTGPLASKIEDLIAMITPELVGDRFTAYFDYLGTEMNIVPQTIPRIDAWPDDFVDQYMIKIVDCTVFAKTHFNRRSKRGSYFDASNESPSCAANVAGPSQHKPSKKVKRSTKGPSRRLLHENVQIDMDYVQRVIPQCTDSGFCVFFGEELHPEVDKYIRSVTECSNEVLMNLWNLCQTFF